MPQNLMGIGWSMVFPALGGSVRIILVPGFTAFIPPFLAKLTPNIDEKEIARGNRLVAEFTMRISAHAQRVVRKPGVTVAQ